MTSTIHWFFLNPRRAQEGAITTAVSACPPGLAHRGRKDPIVLDSSKAEVIVKEVGDTERDQKRG